MEATHDVDTKLVTFEGHATEGTMDGIQDRLCTLKEDNGLSGVRRKRVDILFKQSQNLFRPLYNTAFLT